MLGDLTSRQMVEGRIVTESQDQKLASQAAQAQKRKDPVRRHADGAHNVATLKGADPKRKYVLVNLSDLDALGTYEENGYVREVSSQDGVRLFGMRTTIKPGEVITYRGHVLMSVDKKTADEIRLRGAPGMGQGTEPWDRLEKRLLDRRSATKDMLRGIGGARHMHVENESELLDEFGA
jgi:hypothetical protein